jgi:hypothetical protein
VLHQEALEVAHPRRRVLNKIGSGSSKGDMVTSNDGHSYFAMSALPERTTCA